MRQISLNSTPHDRNTRRQPHSGLADEMVDSRKTQPESLTDLAVRQALEVLELQGLPLGRGKLGESPRQVIVVRCLDRPPSFDVDATFESPALSDEMADAITTQGPRDLVQPRPEPTRVGELPDAVEGPQESLLRQVFCLGVVTAEQPATEPEHRSLVALDEGTERAPVARFESLDEVGILDGFGSLHS